MLKDIVLRIPPNYLDIALTAELKATLCLTKVRKILIYRYMFLYKNKDI